MAKHSFAVLELAKVGAAHRYNELKAEMATLMKAFPHLRSSAGGRLVADTASDRSPSSRLHRRGKLSAAGRKAISDAQKARWAKVRAGK